MSLTSGYDILITDLNIFIPEGCIFEWSGKVAPPHYLPADGAAVSRAAYSGLFANTCPSSTVTITIASPGVVTWTSHPLVAGDKVHFTTSGALPTGIATATEYYVLSTGLTSNSFRLALSPEGTVINTSGSQSGTHTCINANNGMGDGTSTFNVADRRGKFALGSGQGTNTLKFEAGAVDTGTDLVTIPNYNFPAQGQAIVLTTTGALPTGLSLATTYYIIRSSSTTIGFAASQADANAETPVKINLTAAGSGVTTITWTSTSQNVIGLTGGEETHATSVSEEPAHTHDQRITQSGSNRQLGASGGTNADLVGPTTSTGGNAQHNNMPPNVITMYIVRATTYA